MMDNNKRLTPEEMLHRHEISTRYGGAVYLDAAINAMKLYAAQEGAAERITIEELSRQVNEFKDAMFEQSRFIIEKDVLLKEAIGLLQGAYQKVNANNRMDRGKIAHEIGQWLIKNVTSKEGGK